MCQHLYSLISSMQSCVADVQLWTTKSKLQLSDRKSAALLTDTQKLAEPSALNCNWSK